MNEGEEKNLETQCLEENTEAKREESSQMEGTEMSLKGTDGLCPNIFSWIVASKVIFLKLKEWIGGENVVSVKQHLS